MTETIYWIWLAEALGCDNADFLTFLHADMTPLDVYLATEADVGDLDISEKTKRAILNKDLDGAYEINDRCVAHSIGILTYENPKYPSRLKLIGTPPPVLYYLGELPDLNSKLALGMVGTRRISEYGKRYAYKIGYELGAADAVVVSGMALGGDSIAMCAAINGGGKVMAVLGCGVDVVYPKQHGILYREIIKNGAVVSEYPPTTPVKGMNFPIRNRLISGMTVGTLIIECDMKSGAMITARHAVEQGRDLFAIPGKIGESSSDGTNSLIQEGAAVVLRTDDILSGYEFYYGNKIDYIRLSYARARSELDERALEKAGVCSRVNRGAGRSEEPENPEESEELRQRSRNNILRPKIKTSFPERIKSMVVGNKTADKGENKNAGAERRPAERKAIKPSSAEPRGLTDDERKVYEAMPDNRAVSLDYLMSRGIGISEAVATLALLEIKGLVSSMPGGMYVKNQ